MTDEELKQIQKAVRAALPGWGPERDLNSGYVARRVLEVNGPVWIPKLVHAIEDAEHIRKKVEACEQWMDRKSKDDAEVIVRAMEMGAKDEREACAKLVEDQAALAVVAGAEKSSRVIWDMAQAIRARSGPTPG